MITITGASGFIGRHVANELDPFGVHLVDRVMVPYETAHGYTESVVDLQQLNENDIEGTETIVHLAAHANISRNWVDSAGRAALYRDNIRSTIALLEVASHVQTVKRFVLASSGSVYAGYSASTGERARETAPLVATSPYAASKIACEALVAAYAIRFGWEVYIARLASCVGKGYPAGHIVDFVSMMRDNGRAHAADNGLHPKSFVHVCDAARAIAAMARGVMPPGTYNVSSVEVWSWRDTLREMGVPAASFADSDKGWDGDPIGLRLDARKLSRYVALDTPIAQGVQEALQSLGWEATR